MIDIKSVKSNPHILKESNSKRGFTDTTDSLLGTYGKLCSLRSQRDQLLAIRNDKSKARVAFTQKQELSNLTKELKQIESEFNYQCALIPNILDPETPMGKDESENVLEFRTDHKVAPGPDHETIASKFISREIGSKITGSRFFTVASPLSYIYRMLGNFMIDLHTQKHGYTEISVPSIINAQSAYMSGQLPNLENDMFELSNGMFLSPTAEVQLANYFYNCEIKSLPINMVSLTSCFRKESGAAGKNTRGIIRTHQFEKVELFKITSAEASCAELKKILQDVSNVIEALEIPYQIVRLCSGDMGFCAAKTYDFEVWLPGSNQYREISSCSNCTDFQSRRMNMKFNKQLVHTLNGSGTAVGRMFVALIENHFKEDKIVLPDAFADYCKTKYIQL